MRKNEEKLEKNRKSEKITKIAIKIRKKNQTK